MTNETKQRIKREIIDLMTPLGYQLIYGGTKGHGFWVKGMGWKSIPECRAIIAEGQSASEQGSEAA